MPTTASMGYYMLLWYRTNFYVQGAVCLQARLLQRGGQPGPGAGRPAAPAAEDEL
jgi:hypothetical protein